MPELFTTTLDARKYANPTGAGAHIDAPLSNIAISAFSTGEEEFIADMLFPAVPVQKQSDKYYTITKNAFLQIPDALRARKTVARKVEFDVSSDAFYANNYALGAENALEDLANADLAIQLRENSTRLIISNLRRAQEQRVANWCTSATNLGSGANLTGGNKWSDFVNSDPLANVTTAHAFIRSQTGLVANTAMLDWDTWMIVRRHPALLDLYKYTAGGQLNEAQLADAFKVKKLLIGMGIKENALEGGTTSMTSIWGNNALFAYIDPNPTGLQTRTLGLRFQWTPTGLPGPFAVERQTFAGAGQRKVEVVEAGHWQDEKVVAANLGYLIYNTL